MATPATATPRGARAAPASGKDAEQVNSDYQTLWSNMQQAQQKTEDTEVRAVCEQLLEALALRARYLPGPTGVPGADGGADRTRSAAQPFEPPPWDGKVYCHEMRGGVMQVWAAEEAGGATTEPPGFEPPATMETYTRDLTRLVQICGEAAVNSFCHRRLQKLQARFQLHLMDNGHHEAAEQRACPHRDFYNIRKVDTHVHLAAAMNQKHLLRFIKKKMRVCPYEIVATSSDGAPMTLSQVFDEMGIRPFDLNLDSLGMHADPSIFCRFDKFNLKYNPLGKSRLREIFLKSENLLKGRYLAELTRELLDDLEESKYQNAELRISIYGRNATEWDQLAAWVVDHRLHSPNNRWLVQIPRLFSLFQQTGSLVNFEQMLQHIFAPLFEVSADPASHPKLHLMLQQVVGIDCVDDESKPEGRCPSTESASPPPAEWTQGNPHYAYYCYYLYANLHALNQLRARQGYSLLAFRPHAGEAGGLEHLHAAFLTARGINHGINLRRTPSLQYLYYLAQVGLALSPLSNNALFLTLAKSPFYEFFAAGLNVSLSTDDPLMFHHTKEPLMEEYCVAEQVWRLSSVDLAEIARNSVLQSSFESDVKASWLGAHYARPGEEGNAIAKTNIPNLRIEFRHLLLTEEMEVLRGAMPHDAPTAGMTEGAEACEETTTQELAAGHHASAAHPPTSPGRSGRELWASSGLRGSRVSWAAAAVASTLLRLDPSGLGVDPSGPELTVRTPDHAAELPPSEAAAPEATGAAEQRQRHSAGAATRLLPAVVAALLIGVLAGVARSRRGRS